jgi:hypothetical protein
MNEYERWETRYAVPEYAFGKDPNYFLASCKTLLPSPWPCCCDRPVGEAYRLTWGLVSDSK